MQLFIRGLETVESVEVNAEATIADVKVSVSLHFCVSTSYFKRCAFRLKVYLIIVYFSSNKLEIIGD